MPVIVKSQQPPQNQIEMQDIKATTATAPTANPFQNKHERGKALRQVIAAVVANLGTINTGLMFGFSAVVIPQLKRPDSIIPIDENQASWIGKLYKHVDSGIFFGKIRRSIIILIITWKL